MEEEQGLKSKGRRAGEEDQGKKSRGRRREAQANATKQQKATHQHANNASKRKEGKALRRQEAEGADGNGSHESKGARSPTKPMHRATNPRQRQPECKSPSKPEQDPHVHGPDEIAPRPLVQTTSGSQDGEQEPPQMECRWMVMMDLPVRHGHHHDGCHTLPSRPWIVMW